jgi:hypothetical protein
MATFPRIRHFSFRLTVKIVVDGKNVLDGKTGWRCFREMQIFYFPPRKRLNQFVATRTIVAGKVSRLLASPRLDVETSEESEGEQAIDRSPDCHHAEKK